jgi:hypothetical protein
MTIAALPETEREAIRNGASAKKILARKAGADRLRNMRERVALDMRTGELSERLADMILHSAGPSIECPRVACLRATLTHSSIR